MHRISLFQFVLLLGICATLITCHDSSSSTQDGTEPGTTNAAEICTAYCDTMSSCDVYSYYEYYYDYTFDVAECTADCRSDMNNASKKIPECADQLRNILTCVGRLNCSQVEDWWGETTDNYPCATQEDRFATCMEENDYYYDDDYYSYDEEFGEDYYWDDFYYEETYPDPCEAYAEADSCGDWDAYWGDPTTVTVTNEFELDQLANCKCMRGTLSVDTDYLEILSLPNMEVIHGDLKLQNNGALTSVSMAKLTSINGTLNIYRNHALTSMSLPALTRIDRLNYVSNMPIATLDGLSSLTTIAATSGAALNIESTSLEDLDGLSGITTLSATILIDNNPNLISLDGLMNITGFSAGASDEFLIIENDSLPTCEALKLRDALNPKNTPICIMDNGSDACENDYSGC